MKALAAVVLGVVVAGVVGCGSSSGSDGAGDGPPAGIELPPPGSVRLLVSASSAFAVWDAERGAAPAADAAALAPAGLGPGAPEARAVPEARVRVEPDGVETATAVDGTAALDGLAPGRRELTLTRTIDGNLLELALPLELTDESGSAVLVELGPTGARTTTRHRAGGRVVEVLTAPDGSTRVTVDGALERVTTWAGDGWLPAAVELRIFDDLTRLPVGQRRWIQAIGRGPGGEERDLTSLVDWSSTRPAVATVAPWGELAAAEPGTTRIRARLGSLESDALDVTVVPRPSLEELVVWSADCVWFAAEGPPGAEGGGGTGGGDDGVSSPGAPGVDPLPPPDVSEPPSVAPDSPFFPSSCGDVVEVGGTRRFVAQARFGDALWEDVTDEVRWELTPAGLATIDGGGTLTAAAPGRVRLEASLEGRRSEALSLTIVSEPTLVGLDVYTDFPGPIPVDVPPGAEPGVPVDAPAIDICDPIRCGPFEITVLVGDRLRFHALGRYDTGLVRELTSEVRWSSTAPFVGVVGPEGGFLALTAGRAEVVARLGGLESGPLAVRVVREATPVALWLELEGRSTLVPRGDSVFLRARASYDVGFLDREVTDAVRFELTGPGRARVEADGELVGLEPGAIRVVARLGDLVSAPLELEVWERSTLERCDPEQPHRAVWTDDLNRVLLESDCASYPRGATVTMRYTVEEIQANPGALLDPCLDLYVYRGDERVRTLREDGCGAPPLAPALAEEDAALYQTLAHWDQKDAGGRTVPPGRYRIVGVFYIYYDPIIELPIEVLP